MGRITCLCCDRGGEAISYASQRDTYGPVRFAIFKPVSSFYQLLLSCVAYSLGPRSCRQDRLCH